MTTRQVFASRSRSINSRGEESPPPAVAADDDNQTSSQSTTLTELIRELRGQGNPEALTEEALEYFNDDGDEHHFCEVQPPSQYIEDGDRDFETVSSISRMSAITDVILLSDPELGAGRILSLEPPQPDEASTDRPMRPPIRSIVTMGPTRDDPSFETIMFGDGVMKIHHKANGNSSDKSTDEESSAKHSEIGSRSRFPWQRVALLLSFAFILGASAAYIPIIFDSQPPPPPEAEEANNGGDSSKPLAPPSQLSTEKDMDIFWTPPPSSSAVPTTLSIYSPTQAPTLLSTKLQDLQTLSPTAPPTIAPTTLPSAAPSRLPTALPTVAPTPPPTTLKEGILSVLSVVSPTSLAMLHISSTPQNQAYQFLLQTTQFGLHSTQRIIQRYAMAVLYYGTSGIDWEHNGGWLDGGDECLWYSDDASPCNDQGELVRLKLANNNLIGLLPSELGLLRSLEEIQLGGNDVVGQIPTSLGGLQSLQVLDLSWTQIDGRIPSTLGEAMSLERITLIGTSLDGPVPPEIGGLVHLEELLLAKTEITGTIPDAVCRLGLQELWANCDAVDCPCCNYCCYNENIEFCQYV